MKILTQLLKWIGLLLGLPLLVLMGLMVWDARQLERAVEQVAASFTLGESPFIISLPADRIAMVSIARLDPSQTCANLAVRNGVVRSARIAGQVVPIDFDRGIDLTPQAGALESCDRIDIALMANWSYLKGGFTLEYAGSRVTQIGEPRLWD